MPGAVVEVEGIADVQRTFTRLSRTMGKSVKDELRVVAEPFRADTESLARAQIPRMTMAWSRMRTGVTTNIVYVVPRKRGTTNQLRRRPNLGDLLVTRAMDPAVEKNKAQAERRMEMLLDQIHDVEGLT